MRLPCPRWTALATVALLGLVAASAPRSVGAQAPATQPAGLADHPVARQVGQLLADGKVADALSLTDRHLQAQPNDPTIRSIYGELRMAVARQALAAQKFQQAEALLKQVLAIQPDHPTASKMVQAIEQARTRIDPALRDAEELLRLERFEQSAALFAQSAGLIPDQPQRWKAGWLAAAAGAGDDHYLMRNYEAALPFYAQTIELAGRDDAPDSEALLWRWSHCYAMNLARTAAVPRSAAQWASIIEEAKDRFAGGKADLPGRFVSALGRDSLGDHAAAIAAYRQLLGPQAPPAAPTMTPAAEVDMLRARAIEYVDSLNRSAQLDRRAGAWAAVLPGQPLTRKADAILVTARNDLAARRVLEAVSYHAPRLVRYLGGGPADLQWDVDYRILVQQSADSDAGLADLFVPSYTRIDSQAGKLLRHETVCLQSDALLLGATVPHELSHVLVSRLSGYAPVPLALDEGLAIHAETTARYLMFRRSLLEAGGPKYTVAQLLAVGRMPPVGQRASFYAECYHLVAWLLTRGQPAKVVELCRLAGQMPAADGLVKIYEFADLVSAERAYRTFLEDQGLIRRAQPRR